MNKKIVDIARDLNLSPSTISKIVNNTGRISSETRERVLKYVKESGYIAMSNARILSSKKSWTIGVIYSDISLIGFEHPFFSRIFQSFKDYVAKQGYDVVMIVSKLGSNELTYLEWCKIKKVDGILIVMGNINNPNIIEVVNSSYPCISTDIVMPNLHSVICDDNQGVQLAIEHAIKLGFRRIVMVTGPKTARSFDIRTIYFEKEMSVRNIPYNQDDIITTDGFGFTSGFSVGQEIAQRKILPEIIIINSDVIAFGVIRGLNSMGVDVPKDISVIGYDDIAFSKNFNPTLTTILQDTKLIGERAAEELLLSINQKLSKRQEITYIPVKLIERESTKQIK
ncbi:MAG: LacI family transcriptional regulator [Firmicutes bacterium]|nr:LacI family transcriptional regulator [Bacillota bacterium]